MSVTVTSILSLLPLGSAVTVPGYLWLKTERCLLPCSRPKRADLAARYGMYSLVYYAIWAWAFGDWIATLDVTTVRGALMLGGSAASMLPVVFAGGIATGLILRSNLLGKCLGLLGVTTVHPMETGFQWAFMRPSGGLVRMTMADDTERYAHYGNKSLVSIDPEQHDMFFELAYCVNRDGHLVPEVGSRGIWLNRDDIKMIRFYETGDLESDEAKQICAVKPAADAETGVRGRSTGAPQPQHKGTAAVATDTSTYPTHRKSVKPVEVAPRLRD